MVKNLVPALAARLKSWPTTRICIFVGTLGLMMLLSGAAFVGSTGWGKDLFAPGATLMTVALTGYIAASGVVTWAEQRRRDRESVEYKHREEVYEAIVVFMLAQFGVGNYDFVTDAGLRAKAALWASTETVEALSNWQRMLSVILTSRAPRPDGAMPLLPMEKSVLKAFFGATILAMRADLGPEYSGRLHDVDNILDSMFNDRT